MPLDVELLLLEGLDMVGEPEVLPVDRVQDVVGGLLSTEGVEDTVG